MPCEPVDNGPAVRAPALARSEGLRRTAKTGRAARSSSIIRHRRCVPRHLGVAFLPPPRTRANSQFEIRDDRCSFVLVALIVLHHFVQLEGVWVWRSGRAHVKRAMPRWHRWQQVDLHRSLTRQPPSPRTPGGKAPGCFHPPVPPPQVTVFRAFSLSAARGLRDKAVQRHAWLTE